MASRTINPEDFAWVDDYFDHVRSHFDVRQEDQLLIVLPNRAVKVNPTALAVLRHLKNSRPIAEVLGWLTGDQTRLADVYYFLCDFRSLVSGCLGEGHGRHAVRIEPHRQPFNTLPVLSEVAMTYRCNLRCKFCYAGCNCRGTTTGGDAEMSTDEVIRIFHIIRHEAKVPSVSFTGGEPLMRRDVVTLVAAAVKAGLRVNLITNGVLLAGSDLARQLADAGLWSAQVSLEGPTPEVHDALTSQPGSFEKTRQGLSALRDAGVHVHTNTTINALNVDHLDDLVRFVVELGLPRLSMNLIIPAGTAADRELQISYSRIGPIVDRVRMLARSLNVEFLWYSPTPMCIYNPLAAGLGSKSCAACDGLLSVSPAGDVFPCSSFPESVGNLLAAPFEKIWNAARAKFLRNKSYAPPECAGCADFSACAGACPLYWSAMGTAELAEARRARHAVA